jgi:hypothetical protein
MNLPMPTLPTPCPATMGRVEESSRTVRPACPPNRAFGTVGQEGRVRDLDPEEEGARSQPCPSTMGRVPLVALTPAEASDLLELAQAGAADDHSAQALLGHLAALVDRARLHDTRQDTNR